MELGIKEEGFECCEADSFRMLDRYISSSDQEYERCLDILNVKRNIEELPWNPMAQRDEEIIRELQSQFDLCCTPMQELEVFVEDRCRNDQHTFERIMKKVGVAKRILKRERAKQRTFRKALPIVELHKDESTVCSLDEDKMSELKKRNRISAQISRDRKKLYLIELERSNADSKLECHRLKQENQELRRKLEQHQSNKSGSILRLLAFLGILFLIDLVRRTLKGPSTTQKTERVDRREQREFTQILMEVDEAVVNSELRGSEILEIIRGKIRELGGFIQQNFVRAILGSTLLKSFLRVARGLA